MEGTDLLRLAIRLGDQALAIFQENTHTSATAQGPLQENGDNGDNTTEDVSQKEVKVSPVCVEKRGQLGTGPGTNGVGPDDNARIIHRICDLFAKVAVAANARRVTVERNARRAPAEALFRWTDSPQIPEHERSMYRDELRRRAYRSETSARKPQPPRVETTSFDERTLELRTRLQALIDSGEIDSVEPFQLRPAVRVEEPRMMAEALLRDLECPDSARCKNGVAQRDLEDFYNHAAGFRATERLTSGSKNV